MSTAWARRYGSARVVSMAAREEIASRTRECDVDGCTNLVMDGTRCAKCCEELRALEQNEIERAFRRQERAERWDRRGKTACEIWLTVWDWARKSELVDWVLAILAAWAVGYIVGQFADMWIDWLTQLAGV